MLTTQDAWAQKKPWVKMDNNVLTFSYGVKPKGGDVNEVPLNVKHMLDIPWFLFAERILFNVWIINDIRLTSLQIKHQLVQISKPVIRI